MPAPSPWAGFVGPVLLDADLHRRLLSFAAKVAPAGVEAEDLLHDLYVQVPDLVGEDGPGPGARVRSPDT